MALIKTENLALGYDGKAVIEGVNIEINRGDFLCIVGENGSGKSTLMKALLGLKAPMKGEVIYGEGLKKQGIGYLPQQTAAQKDFPASVYEVVLSGMLSKTGFFPFYRASHKKTALENMDRLGIADLTHKCYRELSGGQQQRVLLARALCASSELLLLDEPVTGLDPIVTAELYGIIQRLSKEGLSVVMISHDISAAVNYATHILHLDSEDLFYGTKDDYLESEVGQRLQAPTCCTCIPLFSDVLSTAKKAETSPSIAPVTVKKRKSTVPRIAKGALGITTVSTDAGDETEEA